MAIAFDAATDGGVTTGSSLTFSHTCTATNPILFVGVSHYPTNMTGVTYNSVSLTKLQTDQDAGRYATLWVLQAPSSGANNVVCSFTTNPFSTAAGAISYSGAAQTGQPDSSAANQSASATQITGTTTVVASNCWLVCIAMSANGGSNESGGAGTTVRTQLGASNQWKMFDSNGTVGTGSQSLIVDSNASADKMAIIVASFKPPGAAASTDSFFPFLDRR